MNQLRKNRLTNMQVNYSDSDSEKQQSHKQITKQQLKLTLHVNSNKLKRNFFDEDTNNQQYKFEDQITKRGKVIQRKKQYQIQLFNPQKNENIFAGDTQVSQNNRNHKQNPLKLYQPKMVASQPNLSLRKSTKNESKMLHFTLQQDDENPSSSFDQQQEQKLKNDIQKMIMNNQSSSQPEEGNIFFTVNQDQNKQQYSSSQTKQTKGYKEAIKMNPSMMVQGVKEFFVRAPIPKNTVLMAELIRFNSGINYLYPHFDLVFKDYNCHILGCKKQAGSFGSNYYIATQDSKISQKNENYTGKLRSTNEQGVFNIFGRGQKQPILPQYQNFQKREIRATVLIKCPNDQPRNITVYMMNESNYYTNLKGYKQGEDIGLHKLYFIGQNKNNISIYKTKKAEYIARLGGYFMDFRGRTKQACQRNLVLADQNDEQVLFMGRKKTGVYNIDIWNPLSPHVAIGIAVAQFQMG